MIKLNELIQQKCKQNGMNMKLLGSKPVQFKTDLIIWNQKIDLLALSNENGIGNYLIYLK